MPSDTAMFNKEPPWLFRRRVLGSWIGLSQTIPNPYSAPGFGNAKYLAGQFYFHDMRVFKVMFTIITATTGVKQGRKPSQGCKQLGGIMDYLPCPGVK